MSGFAARIQLAVKGEDDLRARFGGYFAQGTMFVRDDRPPMTGANVLVEFIGPDGAALSTVVARVTLAKPADVPGQATAGMALQFLGLDETAKRLADRTAEKGVISTDAQIDTLSAPSQDGPVLGIDLGTTNSCVAIVENGVPRVLSSSDGYETLPSVVFVSDKNKILTGHKAIERMVLQPGRGIYGSKRFIGRAFAGREVTTFGHFFNYALAEGKAGTAAVKIDARVVPLEWVSACILATLKHTAKQALGKEVTRAVITVPAYFGEAQRQAVRQAGELAGLQVARLLSEPTAAAVAFGYGRGLKKTILVYDLGGGTFDASLLRLDGDKMEVLATDGDAFLGGSDFDDRLTEYVLSMVQRTHGMDLRRDRVSVQRVRLAAETAKKQLSETVTAKVEVPYLTPTVNLDLTIEQSLFESLTDDLVTRTLGIVDNVLTMAGVQASAIDDVVLVGGQSRSPFVARRIQERFGKKPSRGVHPDHAVALGAAIVAAAAYGNEERKVQLTDILPAPIRVQAGEAAPVVLLDRGTPLPAEKEFEVDTGKAKVGSKHAVEYLATLYRGDNELLGQVRLPATLAMTIAKTRAKLTLHVSADGMLTVTMRHPLTDEVEQLRVALTAQEDDAPQIEEADILQ